MADTVKVPGVGGVKRTWVLAGGAVVAGIVGYAWWKRRGAAPPSEEAGPAVPVDQLPAGPGAVSTGGGTTDSGEVFVTTNAQWTQAVLPLLTDAGWDPGFASVALGKYLAHQALDTREVELVQSALALQGPPPVGTFSIVHAATTTSTTTPPPATGRKPATPTGLHVHKQTRSQVQLSWDHASRALGYGLYRNGHAITFPLHNYATVGNITATYTVKAWNQYGYSAASAPLVVHKK